MHACVDLRCFSLPVYVRTSFCDAALLFVKRCLLPYVHLSLESVEFQYLLPAVQFIHL